MKEPSLSAIAHNETVSALEWLPDGSGFLSGGLDRKIILWVSDLRLRSQHVLVLIWRVRIRRVERREYG